jgi:5-oxoprolinase (ATP-hydrolysing) subunit A
MGMLPRKRHADDEERTMANQVNLNADMGECFGVFKIGNDDALLDINTMHHLVTRAKEKGVSIGAHPGFDDLWGFGRRRIDMNTRDLEYMIAYQIGALQGMAAYAGTRVTHLKPHGALNNMAAEDLEIGLAIGRAIRVVDRSIIYVALAGSQMEVAALKLELPLAREGFCDRLYDDDGNLTSRKVPGAVLHDAEEIKNRVVHMVLNEEIVSRNGKRLPRKIDSLCVHGDEPTAVLAARGVREGLEAAGVRVLPLTEMKLT